MADEFEEKLENLSLQGIYQVLKGKKCLKSLLGSSDTFTEVIFMEKITEHCEYVDKKLEKFDLNVQNEKCTFSRNEVLSNLNLLWEISCCGIDCPSFLMLFEAFCKDNGSLIKVLFKCLNCGDHFIVFQSYKVLCEIYKRFPNLVLCGRFEELINLSISDNSENCRRWLPVYTAEIIKVLFLQSESWPKDTTFNEKGSKKQKNTCNCIVVEEYSNEICANGIWSALCCHWLKMTSHFLAALSTIVHPITPLPKDAQMSKFDSFQQILITMLSYGKTVIESCDHVLTNQRTPQHSMHEDRTLENGKLATIDVNLDLLPGETLKNSKRARICEHENLSVSKVQHSYKMCEDLIFNADCSTKCFHSEKVMCNSDCKLLRLLQEIVIQLVEINHKNCLLHFSRTVFQFLNNVVSFISGRCLNGEKIHFCGNEIQWNTGISSFLVRNGTRLLEAIPLVTGEVNFGGQNCGGKQDTSDVCGQSYDEVSLRKVLLLVPKLILVTLHDQKGNSKIIQWEALKEPLESWLNFVCQTSRLESQRNMVWLVKLFSDQDDDLVSFLFSLLQLYQALFSSKSLQPIPSWASHLHDSFNPHCFFMEFLISINYDHSLLLDFLISNETQFLPYLFKYLRHLANDWSGFVETFQQRQLLSDKELLQPLGKVHMQKENGSDFLNGSSNKFSWTGFCDGHCDGGEVSGGIDYGDDRDSGDCDGKDADKDDFCGHDDGGSHGDVGSDDIGDVGDGDDSVGHEHDTDEKDGSDYDSGRNYGNGDQDCSGDHSDYSNNKTTGNVVDDDRSDCNYQIDDDGSSNRDYLNDDEDDSGDCDYHIDEDDDIHGYANNDSDRRSTYNIGDFATSRKATRHEPSDRHNSDTHINETYDNDAYDINYEHTQPKRRDESKEIEYISSPMVLSELRHVEQALSCLIRLRFAIERMVSKGLFPYPVTALVRVMKYVETLYEEK